MSVAGDGPACVFCRRTDRQMTREHVFARWLVERLRAWRDLAPQTASMPPERVGRIVASVCAPCNAGWMSTLEVSARAALFGRVRSGAIPAADRLTLSRWFTKAAVLLADADGTHIVDDASALIEGMPRGVEVSLARRRRPRQKLDFALARSPDATCRVTIAVGDIVAQVAPPGRVSGARGTRIWPLRTHALRWETLPVISLSRPARP